MRRAERVVVILDTDFVCSFLKIGGLPVVRDFFGGGELTVPGAVYREVGVTSLMSQLVSEPGIQVRWVEDSERRELAKRADLHGLGPGEIEALALALPSPGALVLMNDNAARRAANRLGIEVLNVPAFLLACKERGFLPSSEIRALVLSLEDKDHFGFRAEVRDALLG